MSALAVVGTVVLLMLAAAFPKLTFAFAVLAILIYSVPYIFFVHIWPRKQGHGLSRDIWVRQLTPDVVKKWYCAGRLTKEEYDEMMKSLEDWR